MYKEVAFDPSCLSEIEYYYLIKQQFGFEKGRYISADVRAWAQEAMCHVKDAELKPVRKKSVKNYLNKLRKTRGSKEFLLTEDRRPIKATCWNEWVQEQEKIRGFSCVVAEAGDGNIVNIDRINEDCELWSVRPSISVSRTPEGIIGALSPLIQLSGQLTVIDQYFRITDNPVLKGLLKAVGHCSVQTLRIVTSMNSASIEEAFERECRDVKLDRTSFEWIRAPEKFFHDRYVISDVGAVRSGQGFMAEVEKGTHADLANINIIGLEEAMRTLRELDLILEDNRATIELRI